MLSFLAGMAVTAHADVLCRPKNGTTVRVRPACRTQEVQLDPVALGLQGPAGPTGSQGEPGVQGVAGPTGPAGMDGLNAETLHVFDDNGQDLGVFVATNFSTQYHVYDVSEGIVIPFTDPATGSFEQLERIYYDQLNCEGIPFADAIAQLGGNIPLVPGMTAKAYVVPGGPLLYVRAIDNPTMRIPVSLVTNGGTCDNYPDGAPPQLERIYYDAPNCEGTAFADAIRQFGGSIPLEPGMTALAYVVPGEPLLFVRAIDDPEVRTPASQVTVSGICDSNMGDTSPRSTVLFETSTQAFSSPPRSTVLFESSPSFFPGGPTWPLTVGLAP